MTADKANAARQMRNTAALALLPLLVLAGGSEWNYQRGKNTPAPEKLSDDTALSITFNVTRKFAADNAAAALKNDPSTRLFFFKADDPAYKSALKSALDGELKSEQDKHANTLASRESTRNLGWVTVGMCLLWIAAAEYKRRQAPKPPAPSLQ